MLVVLVGWLSFWRKVMEAAILEANLRLRPSTAFNVLRQVEVESLRQRSSAN